MSCALNIKWGRNRSSSTPSATWIGAWKTITGSSWVTNRDLIVKAAQTELIEANKHEHVKAEHAEKVNGNASREVGGDDKEQIAGKFSLHVAGADHRKIGNVYTLAATKSTLNPTRTS